VRRRAAQLQEPAVRRRHGLDEVISKGKRTGGTCFTGMSVTFMTNAVRWSLAGPSLSTIASKSPGAYTA